MKKGCNTKHFVQSVFLCFRQTFACHHSGYHRIKKEENKKGISKNTKCQAELIITVKLTTKDTIKKDAYIKVC